MEINIPFDSSKKSNDLIKYSLLLYSKTNILIPRYDDVFGTEFHDKKLLNEMKMLEKEKIISIVIADLYNISSIERNEIISSVWDSNKIKKLYDQYDFLYAQYDLNGLDNTTLSLLNRLNNLEAKLKQYDPAKKQEYSNEFLEGIKVGGYSGLYIQKEFRKSANLTGENFKNALIKNIDRMRKNLLPGYRPTIPGSRRFEDHTMLQLKMFYNLVSRGQPVLANDLLNTALNEINQNSKEYRPDELKSEALRIFLPHFHEMEFEDIAELYHKAKSEIEQLQIFIGGLESEFSIDDKDLINVKLHLKTKMIPAINELKSKMKDLRISTIQNALNGLKDPKSFTPLLTSFIPSIPAHIGIAGTLGLIAADTTLKYLKQKNAIKSSNPLYFSLELEKIIKKGRKK